jgi:hypothetical protein
MRILSALFVLSISTCREVYAVNNQQQCQNPDTTEDIESNRVSYGILSQCGAPRKQSVRREGCEPVMEKLLINSSSTTDYYLSDSATTYRVVVENEEANPIDVFFFTSPPDFDQASGTFTNSLGTKRIQPKTSQATFTYLAAYYAGAQKQTAPAGQVQSSTVSLVEIGIKKPNSDVTERTELIFDVNGDAYLGSPSTVTGAALNGAFQIQTPVFDPSKKGDYFIGLGGVADGVFQMASYVKAEPGRIVNVQPVLKFYISIGRYERGTDVNFISVSSESALCDATGGDTFFKVKRQADGAWVVNNNLMTKGRC